MPKASGFTRRVLIAAVAILAVVVFAGAVMRAQETSQPQSHEMEGHRSSHAHHMHMHHPDVQLPPGDAERGAQTFQAKNCAKCHATEQTAEKKMGPNLYGVFDPKIHGHAMTQGDVVYQVKHGGKKMPPYGSHITDQELADVVAYLKTLQPTQPASR
jgi:cytochrome c2